MSFYFKVSTSDERDYSMEFLRIWWWIVLVFSVNCAHFLYFVPFVFPSWRNHSFREFVAQICQDDPKLSKYFPVLTSKNNKKEKENRAKSIDEVLSVSISDESWFLLNFMEQNLPDKEFRSFVRKLVVTPNSELQLKQVQLDEFFNDSNNGYHCGESSEEEMTDSDIQIGITA